MCTRHHKIRFFTNMAELVSIMVCVCSFPSSHLVDVNCRFHVLWNDVHFISISALFYLYIKILTPRTSSLLSPQIPCGLRSPPAVTSSCDSSHGPAQHFWVPLQQLLHTSGAASLPVGWFNSTGLQGNREHHGKVLKGKDKYATLLALTIFIIFSSWRNASTNVYPF